MNQNGLQVDRELQGDRDLQADHGQKQTKGGCASTTQVGINPGQRDQKSIASLHH